ncbi:hypothetical protein KR067_012325 [Drosophila pandora]|nr:hypothetical protein KR067_012325 [Drosophila pandora]
MEEERNEKKVLCEKIIQDINAVFQKDADLASFEIIPKETNCNKSPVVHVEHNLGLESWCAQHVYDHAHRTLISHRRQTWQQQLRTLQQQQQSDSLAKYLNVALLINPDVTTFWHIRRQLVQKNRLTINKELQFSALVLSIKPKSNEAFAYRRWLYSFQSADAIDWPNEIGICERAADRCASNYHAWSHRQWILQSGPCLLQSELLRTEKFMRKHISDYSCYHYRQVLLGRAYELSFALPTAEPTSSSGSSSLASLQQLLAENYGLACQARADSLLSLLLPHVDRSTVSEQRLRSFLYCCNVAAHDMRLCSEQRALYGPRDCFDLHRRAALKFIVEQCVRLEAGLVSGPSVGHPSSAAEELQAHLSSLDFEAHPFLGAVRKAEFALGSKHRRWCNLHLSFGYPAD